MGPAAISHRRRLRTAALASLWPLALAFAIAPPAATALYLGGAFGHTLPEPYAMLAVSHRAPPEPLAKPTPVSPCPVDMVPVDNFCIDRFEAHLMRVDAHGKEQHHPHNQRPISGQYYRARNRAGVRPQAYINRHEASRACTLAAKRLCTFSEWRRACQGNNRTLYPYGNLERPGRCNTGKLHLLAQQFGRNPARWSYEKHLNAPILATLPGYLAAANDYSACAAPEGAHDLVGNLHEWVSTEASSALVERLEREGVRRRDQPWRRQNGVFLGGFFSTRNELGPGCLYTTYAHRPDYHDYSTGFRCCAPRAPR